jgi:hypothetical protein
VLIISIDGENDGAAGDRRWQDRTRSAVQPAVRAESLRTMADYVAGKTIPPFIKNDDDFYDGTNAKDKFVGEAF